MKYFVMLKYRTDDGDAHYYNVLGSPLGSFAAVFKDEDKAHTAAVAEVVANRAVVGYKIHTT